MLQAVTATQEVQDQPISRGSVLVVDDEAITAEVVARHLRRAGYDATVVKDGTTAVHAAAALRPDLVLLDVALPRTDGLELMRRLRAGDSSRPAVILLSEEDHVTERVVGLRSGADDYLVKPVAPAEMVARVEAVLRRLESEPTPEPTLEFDDLRLDPTGRRLFVDGIEVQLTQREFDLLLFMARHPGRAFSRDELMHSVWQYSFYTDASTVTVHVRRLRAKIERDPAQPRHLQTVWGIGYRFQP